MTIGFWVRTDCLIFGLRHTKQNSENVDNAQMICMLVGAL